MAENKPFGSGGWGRAQENVFALFSVVCIFLFTTQGTCNLTLFSVTNLVQQDFSHTLHKRRTPHKVLISGLRQGWVNCSQGTELKT